MYEFLEYRVRDVMTREAVALDPESTLASAADIFDAHDFNALPVVLPDGQLVGVLTKLDWLRGFAFTPQNVVPHYEEIMARPVRAQMTAPAASVSPDLPLTRVLETMIETRNKSLPVVERNRLIGIIAREDVLRALRRAVAGERPGRPLEAQ